MSESPSVLLFLGPEEGLKSDELDELRRRISRQHGESTDEHRFYLPDDSVSAAVDLLRNGSLFSEHRLVLVVGVEQLRKKADLAPLIDYLGSPNPDATLVLLSDAIRVDSKLEKLIPGGNRKVFWELFENQKHSWVVGFFRKRQVTITPEAIDLFLEVVENNTQELRNEADKLCTYVGASGSVDVEEIETFIYHSREESVFTLFKHITGAAFESALTVLDKLVSSGDAAPVQVVGGLVFQLRRLLALRLLLDNDVPAETAFRRLNVRGKRIQAEYHAGAQKFQASELETAIQLLTEYDALFRSQRPGIHKCLLDLMVYQLLFHSQRLVRPLGLAADDRLIADDGDDLVLAR
ncbi:MAG: DNA polymerase III subunit delta [Spirochaetia bacterium]